MRSHRGADVVRDDDHVRGPREAAVTIIEYGDYECPHTRAAHEVVERLLAANPDVCFVYRHFPLLDLHPNAERLACIAEAADGAFWEVHERLMTDGQDVDDELEDDAIAAASERVDRDVGEGMNAGVSSTPTFFFSGDKHDGHYDYATLEERLRAARR